MNILRVSEADALKKKQISVKKGKKNSKKIHGPKIKLIKIKKVKTKMKRPVREKRKLERGRNQKKQEKKLKFEKKVGKFEKKEKELVGPSERKLTQEDIKKITTILADSKIRQRLIELGGENALSIIRSFYGIYSDEDIAKKLELKISDVRATLNKLHNEGLVNYLREKDNETGWYSYSWSLNVDRVEKWATDHMSKQFLLSEDGQQYYCCMACGDSTIVDFESAFDINFRCEQCERALEHVDQEKMALLCEGRKE